MRKQTLAAAVAFVCLLFAVALSAQYGGWTIPAGGKEEQSPIKSTDAVLKKGKSLFQTNCQKCHGPQGKGDGPDSDPKSPAADLTDDFRTELNTDGILYYKVLNGHVPEMPAFKSKLSKDEVWSVVAYIKTLRKP